jgi:hypothetical protein
MEFSTGIGTFFLQIPLKNDRVVLLRTLRIADIITALSFLAIWAWFTDGWGHLSTKPDPLLFAPVRDRSAYKKLPQKSRNVAEAMKASGNNHQQRHWRLIVHRNWT